MLNMLLTTLMERLTMTNMILGIALAIIGLSCSILSTRIARMVRKSSNVSPNDRVIIVMKTFGLIFMLLALIIIVIK